MAPGVHDFHWQHNTNARKQRKTCKSNIWCSAEIAEISLDCFLRGWLGVPGYKIRPANSLNCLWSVLKAWLNFGFKMSVGWIGLP